MSGADMVVQVLADEGVDTIFGYSGGAILPTYDAVFRYNATHKRDNGTAAMPLIVPANEQGAGFMAAGYARASGKVGVVMVTSGPGATNTVTPVRDCMADSVPIVVICGQVPSAAIGTDAFQEAPVSAIMGAVAKHIFLVTDPEKLEATMRSAFELARTGRPGPVVIDIPKDVQNWEGEFKGQGALPLTGLSPAPRCRRQQSPERRTVPAFLHDAGTVRTAADLRRRRRHQRQCEQADATFRGRLRHPGDDDADGARRQRYNAPARAAHARHARHRVGQLRGRRLRFPDRDRRTFRRSRRRRPRRLCAERQEHRALRCRYRRDRQGQGANWHHVGMLARDLEDLLAYGRRIAFAHSFSGWHAEIALLKKDYGLNYDRDSELIQPYAVIEEINRHTKGEAIISTGVGQHQMWAAQYFDYREPRLWLTSGSMGTMGFGLPAAIGAQFARPDRVVIDIDGDASIRMNIGELETATTYKLPIKVVVLNNFGDGMVRQWQKLYYNGRMSASDKSLHSKDFVKAAEADGFRFARRLERNADIAADDSRLHGVRRARISRGDHRSRCRRLPDGRPGTELREDDHGRAHQEPRKSRRRNAWPQRDVLARHIVGVVR